MQPYNVSWLLFLWKLGVIRCDPRVCHATPILVSHTGPEATCSVNDGLEPKLSVYWWTVSLDAGTCKGADPRIICNGGMAMPWLPVAVTAQVIMGTGYVYSTKACTATWSL